MITESRYMTAATNKMASSVCMPLRSPAERVRFCFLCALVFLGGCFGGVVGFFSVAVTVSHPCRFLLPYIINEKEKDVKGFG